MVSLWERGNSVKGHSHFWCQRNYILLLPSSVDKKIGIVSDLDSNRFVSGELSIWCNTLYRGWRWQDDVSNGGFQLVDGGSALMSAIVWLNGLDFYMELPGFIFVLWVAGWIEGIIFGMWKKNELRRQKQQTSVKQKTKGFPHRCLNFIPDLKTEEEGTKKRKKK